MNEDVTKIKERRIIHPAMGWISLTVSTYEGVINQNLSDHEVQKYKQRLEENPLSKFILRNEGEPINLAELLSNRPVEVSEAEVREAVTASMCSFECGIVNEIGALPPGFPEPDYNPGDKVFFHEGKGLDIGDVKLMTIDGIIGWSGE